MQHFRGPAPRVAAGRVGADGDVGNQADRHPGFAGCRLRGVQTDFGAPLQIGVEGDFVRVLGGKPRHLRAVRAAQSLRPGVPVVRRMQCVQHFKARVTLQRDALRAAVFRQRGIIRIEGAPMRRDAGRGGGRPVDQRIVAIGNIERRRFGMQHVQADAAGWRVGAEMARVGGEQRVDWADRDGRRTLAGGFLCQDRAARARSPRPPSPARRKP